MMKLTEKQKRFADYYIETLNATLAYHRAGYSVKNDETAAVNASRLLRKANVQEYIANIMDQKANKRIMSQDEVLELLTQMALGEIQEEQIVAYNKHYEIATRQVAPRDRIKAAELLGKRYALFTDRIEAKQEVIVEWAEDDEDND
jgi:phage terminase small subunit